MVREVDFWDCFALMLTRIFSFFAMATALVAQAPIAQDGAVALKQRWLTEVVATIEPSLSTPIAWEAGSFTSSRHHESWMPLVDGEGLGTALRGTGLTFAGGWAKNGWTIQGRALAFKEYETNASRLRIHEFELSRQTRGGWQFGIKQGPMDWGYGMAGGYLMGASHLPFARAFLETPQKALSLFGIPLGRWQVQTFLGRLEWERTLPEWTSDLRHKKAALANAGDRRRPEISGLRFLAHFGEHLEMNIGGVSRWGGVRKDGTRVMDGTTGGEYLLAFLGAENLVVAEGSGNAEDPDPNNRYKVGSTYKNLSNAVVNVEFRLRLPALARAFGAQGFALYLSRGGNNVNWQWKDFLRRPGSAISHDFRFYHNAFTKPDAGLLHSDPGSVWGWGYSQAVPSLTHVNDTLGAQWVFPTWDLAAEVSDTRNQTDPGSTYRTYSNGTYISGHSYYGDSLGQAFGGEVYRQSLNVGWRPGPTWRIRLLLADAIRVPRDIPDWRSPPRVDDHFLFIQLDVQKRFGAQRIGGSLALDDHNSWQYVKGQRHRNAILSLGWSRTF